MNVTGMLTVQRLKYEEIEEAIECLKDRLAAFECFEEFTITVQATGYRSLINLRDD